jgi:hypothetical protein
MESAARALPLTPLITFRLVTGGCKEFPVGT